MNTNVELKNELEKQKENIKALEYLTWLKFDSFLGGNKVDEKLVKEFEEVFDSLKDGRVDPEDCDEIVNKWIEFFGNGMLEETKKELSIRNQLQKLYGLLAKASDEDLRLYLRTVLLERFSPESPTVKMFLMLTKK